MSQGASSNRFDLSGKVAIVTGAAGGLGRSYALALAQRGAAVVVNDLGGDTRGNDPCGDLAEAVAQEIRESGGRAISNADSVATRDGGLAITEAALKHFSRIDIVVNNAGNQRNALFEDLSEDDIESVIAVHLKGAFFVTQPAYRRMKQQGSGRIIFTSSQSGVFGNPYRANYGAAKTGVLGLMRVLVQEAPAGIRINSIMPNARGGRMGASDPNRVDREFLDKIMARGNAYADQMSPDYCAGLVTWLASDECDVTGQTFSVLRGNYARVLLARTSGWCGPRGICPSPEDIADHYGALADAQTLHEPCSGIDEGDVATAALNRVYGPGNVE